MVVAKAEVVVARAEVVVAKTEVVVAKAEVSVAKRNEQISELRDGAGLTNIGEGAVGNRWEEDGTFASRTS